MVCVIAAYHRLGNAVKMPDLARRQVISYGCPPTAPYSHLDGHVPAACGQNIWQFWVPLERVDFTVARMRL